MEASVSGNWFLILHALGAAQGLLLALVLVSRPPVSLANRYLAGTMLAFSLDLIAAVYHATGLDASYPSFIGFDFPLAFIYGPLLYLYARALARRERTFERRNLLHFIPFLLAILVIIPFAVQEGSAKLAYIEQPDASAWTTILIPLSYLKLLHALSYVTITLVLIRNYHRQIKDRLSSIERVRLNWLRNLMIGIIALALFAIVGYLIPQNAPDAAIGLDPATLLDDYSLLGIAILVYAIGYAGLRQPDLFDGKWQLLAIEDEDQPRYVRSGMDPQKAEALKQRILELMQEEALYRNPQFALRDLAEAASSTPHNLTEVINTLLDKNFYDFVNAYRVAYVKERLQNPADAHFTILSIGLDAGFNSKSSFNAVFKKHTGLTPSQFRQQTQQNALPDAKPS